MYTSIAVFVPVMFVVVGTAATVFSIRSERQAREFDRRALQAMGVVTGMRDVWVQSSNSDVGSSGHWDHYPTVSYRTLSGVDVQTVTKDDVKPRDYPVGRSVTVRYEPEDPTVAHVCERHANLGRTAFLVLFSLVFVAVGVGILVHHFVM